MDRRKEIWEHSMNDMYELGIWIEGREFGSTL